jgi:hypothetical protein
MRKTVLLSASMGIAVFLACVVALLAALASAPAASAVSGDHGASFALFCNFSHRSLDDPIKYPGIQGTLDDTERPFHSHDFFGNTSTKFDSTYESMRQATTTCTRPEDTASYWFPTVSWKDQNGTHQLTPNRTIFYYRAGGKDHTTVRPFAANLKIINDKRITWYCGIDDNKVGSPDPPTQCESGVLGVRIIFPDCVATDANGEQVTDSFDHKSHMVRSKPLSDGTRGCPENYVPVPTLTINSNFPIPPTTGQVTLSSDHPGDPPATTMHADFWNTWDQDTPFDPATGRGGLSAMVKHCINEVPPSDPRPRECKAPRE